jgi:hypothetical protein
MVHLEVVEEDKWQLDMVVEEVDIVVVVEVLFLTVSKVLEVAVHLTSIQ